MTEPAKLPLPKPTIPWWKRFLFCFLLPAELQNSSVDSLKTRFTLAGLNYCLAVENLHSSILDKDVEKSSGRLQEVANARWYLLKRVNTLPVSDDKKRQFWQELEKECLGWRETEKKCGIEPIYT